MLMPDRHRDGYTCSVDGYTCLVHGALDTRTGHCLVSIHPMLCPQSSGSALVDFFFSVLPDTPPQDVQRMLRRVRTPSPCPCSTRRN